MAGNPYHDENGKFCSKEHMFDAIIRLQLDGKSSQAAALFEEYRQAAEGGEHLRVMQEEPEEDRGWYSTSTGAVEAPWHEPPDGVEQMPPVGFFQHDPNLPVEQQVANLKAFFAAYKLKAGEPGGAEHPYVHQVLQKVLHDGNRTVGEFGKELNYDPRSPEPQPLLWYSVRHGAEEVNRYALFVWQNRLYGMREPELAGSWNQELILRTPFPVAPEPLIGEEENYFTYEKTGGFNTVEMVAEIWGRERSWKTGKGLRQIKVEDATLVYQKAIYDDAVGDVERSVYRDDITGDLFEYQWSNYGYGSQDEYAFWSEVNAVHQVHPAQIEFQPYQPES